MYGQNEEGSGALPAVLRDVLGCIAIGDTPTPGQLATALRATVSVPGQARDVALGSIMTATMLRGPSTADVVSLIAEALSLDRPVPESVASDRRVLLVAGSGKKGQPTPNVSTPAALVAAAAGAYVVKIGSAGTSSAVGSRDLVQALGIRECANARQAEDELAACGFAFVAVEPSIPQLDAIYGGRFHVPNPFSFGLAVLASPVRGDAVVLGLSHPRVEVAAEVLHSFGFAEADVITTRVKGRHYVDELWPGGEVSQCSVSGGAVGAVRAGQFSGLAQVLMPGLGTRRDVVDAVVGVLSGLGHPGYRALVAANAAHLLVQAGIVDEFAGAVSVAEEVMASGLALRPCPWQPRRVA